VKCIFLTTEARRHGGGEGEERGMRAET